MDIKNIYDNIGGAEGIIKGASAMRDLFSRKKKDDGEILLKHSTNSNKLHKNKLNSNSPYSENLQRLLNLVTEDGEITDEELKMLQIKAEKEGIDPLEIEIVAKRIIKKKKEELEQKKKLQEELKKDPVKQIKESFKAAEAVAKGGNDFAGLATLTETLNLIPGLQGIDAVGLLASSLLKTPSNLNSLKAEIINNISIPEDEKLFSDFLLFCHTQLEVAKNTKNDKYKNLSGIISTVAFGSEMDLEPIWQTKIDHLISRSKFLFPYSQIVHNTIKLFYVSPVDKLRKLKSTNKKEYYKETEAITVPPDNRELIDLVEFAFFEKDDPNIFLLYKRMYKAAEVRFSRDAKFSDELKKYKIKKFGLF